jgi:23S rRNA (pseudouridine1915-N3)-methyltransferase
LRKIRLLAIGKDKEAWVADASAHYCKLLSKFAKMEIEIVPKARLSTASSPEESRKAEGDALLPRLRDDLVVALWDRGEQKTSEGFAKLIDRLTSNQRGTVTFVIGGAFGLDKRVLTRADLSVSLSSLTFSHQIVRLVLLEQLYRAFTILQGSSYHK